MSAPQSVWDVVGRTHRKEGWKLHIRHDLPADIHGPKLCLYKTAPDFQSIFLPSLPPPHRDEVLQAVPLLVWQDHTESCVGWNKTPLIQSLIEF